MKTNTSTVKAMYSCFRNGEIEQLLTHLHPQILWEHSWQADPPESHQPRKGRAQVEDFFRALGDLEFVRFEPKEFLAGGQMVAVPIEVEIVERASGRTLCDLEMHMWVFDEDGLVTYHRTFMDSAAMKGLVRG